MGAVRKLGVRELGKIDPVLREFQSFANGLPAARYNPGGFLSVWEPLVSAGIGAIFVAESPEGIDGGIGGVVSPSPFDGKLEATEIFWYVLEERRAARSARGLVEAYLSWAKEKGAQRVVVSTIPGSTEEKVGKWYRRLGFTRVGTSWAKEV